MSSFPPIALFLLLVLQSAYSFLTGINLAGLEFGSNIPGTVNVDYAVPTNAEIDYFIAKGMNVFRLPFLWERLQPTQNGSFVLTYQNYITNFVTYATGKGAQVILDPHNYARYNSGLLGQAVPVGSFANLWSKLATLYKDNSLVIFGLMNEPNSMATELWFTSVNPSIAAIRATGATNYILVPGNAWTGAHSWMQNWYGSPNGQILLGVVDPLNNFGFEVHQYLDSNFGGLGPSCVDSTIGSVQMATFTSWLRTHGYKGFLGEFAGGANSVCNGAVTDLLNYLKANSDVYLGWTWWAGGPMWGNYIFGLDPVGGSDAPQMSVILPFLTGLSPSAPPTTRSPTKAPTSASTSSPTKAPTSTLSPTSAPTRQPTRQPTAAPSGSPTSLAPTRMPTTLSPTTAPTVQPTITPPTAFPTGMPTTARPTASPTPSPTTAPVAPTIATGPPTISPTPSPSTLPTSAPTSQPTAFPTGSPTTRAPTPTSPTSSPTASPTGRPTTRAPTASTPTSLPTAFPSEAPTEARTTPPLTASPTASPTALPQNATCPLLIDVSTRLNSNRRLISSIWNSDPDMVSNGMTIISSSTAITTQDPESLAFDIDVDVAPLTEPSTSIVCTAVRRQLDGDFNGGVTKCWKFRCVPSNTKKRASSTLSISLSPIPPEPLPSDSFPVWVIPVAVIGVLLVVLAIGLVAYTALKPRYDRTEWLRLERV